MHFFNGSNHFSTFPFCSSSSLSLSLSSSYFLTKYRKCYTKQAFLIIFIKVFETLLYILYLKFDAECLAVWVVHRLLTFFSQLQSVLLENWRKTKRKKKKKNIESVQMFNHCLICFLQCFDPVFLQKYMCNRIDV